jgi:hypothetical protein
MATIHTQGVCVFRNAQSVGHQVADANQLGPPWKCNRSKKTTIMKRILKFLSTAKDRYHRAIVQRFQRLSDKPYEITEQDVLSTRRVAMYCYLDHYNVVVDNDGHFHLNGRVFTDESHLLTHIKNDAK